MTIFKACDVRGVVGRDWDAEEARNIGQALGQILRRSGQGTIVVGGDFRRSTPRLKGALIAGLGGTGITVRDVGQVATPVVQYAARAAGCPNLAIVTASHNPGEYNGIKLMVAGRPPIPQWMRELEDERVVDDPTVKATACHTWHVTADYQQWVVRASREFIEEHVPTRTSAADDRTPLRIVVDTMGGAFTELAPRVIQSAGYDVVSIDDQLDPDFGRRDPNPAVDANLQQLQSATIEHQADAGLALDGDGDRVIFVDARGTIVRPEQIAALLLRHCLGACTVVYDLKCASLVPRTAVTMGGRAVMQPSGHGFIKHKLLELQAEMGVEVSGHHFFGCLEGGDDGLFTALVLLRLLDAHAVRLGDWLAEVPLPAITPDLRLEYRGDAAEVLESIATSCGGQVSRLDGVRCEYEDHGWALARASITEPAITFRFEGRDQLHVREIARRFLGCQQELYQRVMEKMS